MMRNKGLWERLQTFELDDGQAHFRFTDRLAQENGWSPAFAKRATEEYKKFVYLAMIAGHPVTPSDIVDQVWHLHLTFTRSYWEDMCGRVIGKPLHHGPTLGGAAEDAKYREQYTATLQLYEREFGTPAPLAVWPYIEERFAGAPHQLWVDKRKHFVIRKTALRPLWTVLSVGTIGALTVAAAAASEAQRAGDSGRGWLIMLGVFAVLAIAAGLSSQPKRGRKRRADGSAAGGCGTGGSGGESGDCGDGGSCGDGGGGGCGGGGCGS